MKRKRVLFLAILIFGICCGISAEDTKIVVVSDPHVMAPDLKKEGTAWTNYLAGQRKLVDYSQQLFDEMINRIKTAAPDLVLITGDLTKDGEQMSHEYVIGKLDELRAAGINTLVIPGNHDIGETVNSNSNAVSYNSAGTSHVDVATKDWFADQYANYGYDSSNQDGNSLSYACEPLEGLVVIGIDSSTGEVPETTLSWVEEQATAARASGKRVIAMMHHPLIPHITNAESLVNTYVVNNHDEIRNALINAGVRVIFTGHFHTSDIAKDFNDEPIANKEIYDVNTGSLISYPCDYRTVTLSSDLSEMNINTEHISSLPGDETFSADYAKDRLHASVKKIVKDKAMAIAKAKYEAAWVYMASMIEATIDGFANNVADAFIIHAEGNEVDVNTETLISSLSMAFSMMEGSEAMCKSMLYDLAPYGIEGRENQTNDLTLDIELPASIKLAADGYSTYCSENGLDITKTAGLTAYIVGEVTDETVVLKKKEVIPAETGFIVKGTGGTIYDLFKAADTTDDVSDNLLHGTLIPTAAPAHTYVLSTKGGDTGFFPATTGIMIPAHKAYLTLESSGVRSIVFDDMMTGIEEVRGEMSDGRGVFYNLAGQRVSNPTNGIYIVDGKKVIIK